MNAIFWLIRDAYLRGANWRDKIGSMELAEKAAYDYADKTTSVEPELGIIDSNEYRLIDAAPSLLEALKAFVDAEDLTGQSDISISAYDKRMEAAYEQAVAAIARVEAGA